MDNNTSEGYGEVWKAIRIVAGERDLNFTQILQILTQLTVVYVDDLREYEIMSDRGE